MKNIVCAKCENEFDLDIRVPRLMGTCGHTFCTLCLENLI